MMRYSPGVLIFCTAAASMLSGYIVFQVSWIYWGWSGMHYSVNNLQFYPYAFSAAAAACLVVVGVAGGVYRRYLTRNVASPNGVENDLTLKDRIMPHCTADDEVENEMTSHTHAEVNLTVNNKELIERMELCVRICLAKMAKARGDGWWMWQGRLAAYKDMLAALKGDTEGMLQYSIINEENKELADKLDALLGAKPNA